MIDISSNQISSPDCAFPSYTVPLAYWKVHTAPSMSSVGIKVPLNV